MLTPFYALYSLHFSLIQYQTTIYLVWCFLCCSSNFVTPRYHLQYIANFRYHYTTITIYNQSAIFTKYNHNVTYLFHNSTQCKQSVLKWCYIKYPIRGGKHSVYHRHETENIEERQKTNATRIVRENGVKPCHNFKL